MNDPAYWTFASGMAILIFGSILRAYRKSKYLREAGIEGDMLNDLIRGMAIHREREEARLEGASNDTIKSELEIIEVLNGTLAKRYARVQRMLDEYLVATTRTAEAVRREEADAEKRQAILQFNDEQVAAIRDEMLGRFSEELAERDEKHASDLRAAMAKADRKALWYFVGGIGSTLALGGLSIILTGS